MNSDELENALQEMNRALLPRTPDGLIEPMQDLRGSAPELYYPAIKALPDGTEPGMLLAEDFAGGKTPPYLEFIPGREKQGMNFEQDGFAAIAYTDPVRNLPFADQRALKTINELRLHPEMPSGNLKKELGIHGVKEAEPVHCDFRVVEHNGKLCLLQENCQKRSLCNFTVCVLEYRVLRQRGQQDQEEIFLNIRCGGVNYELSVRSAGLDCLASTITSKFPACRMEVGVYRAQLHLSNYVREQLHSIHRKLVLLSTGFEELEGHWVFVHDNAPSPSKDILFETGYTIPCRIGMPPGQAGKEALDFLSITDRLELILPLFLVAHLGPLSGLFAAALHRPQFVVFLNGTTGSMKTSLSLCLFRLFRELPSQPEASFYDTASALRLKLSSANGRVLLVDDYRPAVTRGSGQEWLEKLEMIIRFAGDSISRSRSSISGQLRSDAGLNGCLLVTGENTGGSQSSLLRCLVLSIQKNDLSGPGLKVFQDDPLRLQTHFYHFLQWCGRHGDEIVETISVQFEQERAAFETVTRERRQVDIGATLSIVADLLLQYLSEVGTISMDERATLYSRWHDVLKAVIRNSVEASKGLDPVVMYLQAYFDLLTTGKLSVAGSQDHFDPKNHIGFLKGDVVWLFPHELYAEISRYWSGRGQLFPLQEQKIHELLFQHQLIQVDREDRDGKEKILYLRKSSLPRRPRLLVLSEELARQYLEYMEESV